jgi:general secretion pathway protein G
MLLTTIRIARANAPSRSARRAAFTLLEVLIVVAILVILASAASFAYFRYLEDARVNRAKTDMRVIKSAIEKFDMEHQDQPDALNQLQQNITLLAPYLEQGETALHDPWGNLYGFQVDSSQDNQSFDGGMKRRIYVTCNGAPGKQGFTVPDQNTNR